MTANEFNFVDKNISLSDKDLFFGPLDDEEFIEIEEKWIMANIVFAMGIFPSITQARKNGFDKPIPDGFTDIRIGKSKARCTIFREKK